MLAIVNYVAGNQTSVARALRHLDIPCVVTDDDKIIAESSGIIFPGVGSAASAMASLRAAGLDKVLKDAVGLGKPLLGICLGCQILLDHSAEGDIDTLGVLTGQTLPFPADMREADGSPCPIPHMGWNSLRIQQSSPLFKGISDEMEFYFVHSYYVRPSEELIMATSEYGNRFCSVYGRDGLWGVQFHVEKSGSAGLRMLRNFYDYCLERNNVV